MVLACLVSAFNSIGGSCLGWVGERIKEETAYVIAYSTNVEDLKKQVRNLTDAIKSMKQQIQEAENNRGATLVDPVIETLLERMASSKEVASKIIMDDERESDSKCLMGLRPNLWACYLTSKSAKSAIDEAVELLERGAKYDGPVANVDYSKFLGVTPIPHFEEFASRVLVSTQIVAALRDPSVNMVGVYGMSGNGKTALVEKIGADLQLDRTFNYVVLATVSKKQSQLENNYQPDLLSIQEEIAEGLKIQLQSQTLNSRATQLRDQLRKRDKLLIILDDIWSKFELEKVGIPVDNKTTTKLKILMTSRSRTVLENDMKSTNNFGLDSLPPHDARTLFDKMVGGDAQYSSCPLTAQQVIHQCGGIPVLLATTGSALRNVNPDIWDEALIQLKKFDGEDFGEDAYKRIEVSYKFLKDEEMKKIFLLCAQLNSRCIEFGELLKYTVGLELFKERKKIKEVRGRLHKKLHDLKGCCLLQDGNEEGTIKMHDVIHKFATFVASRDYDVFSVANDGELEKWPSKEQFEKYTAVSFFRCSLPSGHELPEAFDNSKLESFLMLRSNKDASFRIPDNFFVGMKRLKLMNLTMMSLSPVLVSSLGALVELRTLCLDYCELSDIAVIGELPMLQALSLVGSSIVSVPQEIGNLGSTLKLLDMSHCIYLETIAAGVISKLTLLEDLRIGSDNITWERLEGSIKSNNSADEIYEVASLEEFKSLCNLINLELHIPYPAETFPKDLFFKKLETFIIFIGWNDQCSDYMLPRTLMVHEHSIVIKFDNEGTKALMTQAESLLLIDVKSSVSLSEIDPKGFPELKHLKIEHGDGFQYILKKDYHNCMFPNLETLDLFDMYKLERIFGDHDHSPPVGSFENLRVINVAYCRLLNDLLSSHLARSLQRLKEIIVVYCESMETIIVQESENLEEMEIGFTHELRVLKLYKLPRLVSFCSFKQVEGLPSPTLLFNKKIVFPKLEELELGQIQSEKIWDDHLAIAPEGTSWFQNLTRLSVDGCENLSYLFTFAMVKSLLQLKNLEINYCKAIEEIVMTMKEETEGERILLFPKLEYLYLTHLPKLKFFCHANLLECQALQKLEIRECPLLNAFIGSNDSTPNLGANSTTLFDEKIVFPNLDESTFTGIRVEKIWYNESVFSAGMSCWLQNLTYLHVYECDNLRNLFTSSMVRSLANLKQLRVNNCEVIEEIVERRKGEMEGERSLMFPKLESLMLHSLPNLKRFCHANLLECQLLQELSIENCPGLVTFMSTTTHESTPNNSTTLFTQKVTTTDSTPDDLTTLFTQKIVFPNLDESTFTGIRVEKIWYNESVFSAGMSCWLQNLTDLHVCDCDNLRNLFTSTMVRSLANLKQLRVNNCEAIEEIVERRKGEMEGERSLMFPKLESLMLHSLPNLKRFCHANLLECQLLQKLFIENCPGLVTFMSTTTDESTPNNSTTLFTEKVVFPNLEKLEIYSAGDFKMICVADELPFPRLKILDINDCLSLEKVFDVPMNERDTCSIQSLLLLGCPSLTSIFPASLLLTLQHLERFEVRDCDKLDLFGFNNTQQLNDALAKVISSSEHCHLESRCMILENTLHSCFLKLVGYGFQVPPILFALLKSLPDVGKVIVSNYTITQLFPCEPDHHLVATDDDDIDTQAKTPAHIRHLKLTKLCDMEYIWSEDSPLKYHGIPLDPEVLEVAHSYSLLCLAPPFTTLFKNLTGLIVRRCPMLIKLITSSSTAKSLVNLKLMCVRECESLEEIVVIDDQHDELASNDQCIVFDKLKFLKLQDLNSLICFCSASDCNFQFPSLSRVIVANCPKMKFFSNGALSTPKLASVWPGKDYETDGENQTEWNELDKDDEDEDKDKNEDEDEDGDGDEEREYEWRWEGDLNSTILQLFEEMVYEDDESDDDDENEEENDEDEEEDEDDGGEQENNEMRMKMTGGRRRMKMEKH